MQMIKRTLSIVLTVVMLVSMFSMVTVASAAWDGSVATAFASGSGSEADPYIIMNASQLAYYVSGNGTSSYVKLGADIIINENVLSEDYALNAGSFREWPVNSTTLYGSGVFDGDGHTIYGFYATANKAGLFYCIEGTVKNLTIADSYVGAFNATHGILGYKTNGGTIENVVVDGLAGGNHNGAEYGRGLMFGSGLGTFTNCITRGKVTAGVQNESAQKAGPFIGSASSGTSFTNCVNYADVDNLTQTGGFVGYTGGSLTFTDCINYGNISTRQKYNSWEGPTHQRHGSAAGGFVGVTYGGSITFTRCANEGTINGDAYSGGFVGVVLQRYTPTITINNSYNLGAVSCQATNGVDYHGDFVGHVYAGNQVTDTNSGAGNLAIYQAAEWLGEGADRWTCVVASNPYLTTFGGNGHVHSYTESHKAPTCTENGTQTAYCDNGCGIPNTIIEESTGHEEMINAGRLPTCTEPGFTEGKTCAKCGEILVPQEMIDALKHNEAIKPEKAPTCTKEGLTEGRYCIICEEDIIPQQTIEKLGHDYTKKYTKATTSKDGKIDYTCNRCGKKTTKKVSKIESIKLSQTTFYYNGEAQTPEKAVIKDADGNSLKLGTDYDFDYASGSFSAKVGTYKIKIVFKGKYSGSKTLSFKIVPAMVKTIKATATTTSVTLKWNKAGGATGYRVYRYDTKAKKWVKVKSSTKETTYTIKGLKAGTAYTFAVKPYYKSGDTVVWSKYTQFETATAPETPKVTGTSNSVKTANLSWNKVSGATGYVVYYSKEKNGTYTKVEAVKTTSFSKKFSKNGEKYYYKVRAYKKTANGNVYSSYSTPVVVNPKVGL